MNSMVGLKQGSTLNRGKYKIVKILGQGSFGITYLATTRISMDGQLGKMDVKVNVTIKEFFMSDLNSRATDGTNVERTSSTLVTNYLNKFRREAENLSKLHHPNIVKVLEVFDENNTTYYVMEFIDGETLDDYIIRNGKLSVEETLAITKEVCKALSYMHDHKMLHLDLKPKNIMRNSEGHIYLIDFGLAKQYNDNGEPESSTTLGLGTPGFAPIEQAHYKQDGTFPVTLDIYAVGASIYKMLTGKTPPDSSYVLNEGLPLDRLKQAGVSDNVIAIVEKAMAPIKKDRYQTVAALSEAISNISPYTDERTVIQDEESTVFDHGINNNQVVISKEKEEELDESEFEDDEPSFFEKNWKYGLVAAVVLLCIYFWSNWNNSSSTSQNDKMLDSLVVDSISADTVAKEIVENTTKSVNKEVEKEKKVKDEVTSKQKETSLPVAQSASQSQNVSTSQHQGDNSSIKAETKPVKTDAVYDVVETMPKFPGGQSGLMAYLSQNVKYPAISAENGIQGRVMVAFVVEKDGSISNVQVTKSVDPSLDREAVRVVKAMPNWSPGTQNGSAVRVRYHVPITFRLQ